MGSYSDVFEPRQRGFSRPNSSLRPAASEPGGAGRRGGVGRLRGLATAQYLESLGQGGERTFGGLDS